MTAPDIREVPALDPDPLDATSLEGYWERAYWRVVPTLLAAKTRRSIPRWYLLASFVTGLLLGAAVARVVNL